MNTLNILLFGERAALDVGCAYTVTRNLASQSDSGVM